MKRIFLSLSIIFSLLAQSQMITDTISMGASYAQDVYYSVNGGVVATVDRDNWDLAFGTNLFDVAIHINEAKGMELYEASTDVNDWATLDTSGMSWTPLHNSDTTWESGAFNANSKGGFNYGWGDYNTTTHMVYAAAIYVIKLADGSLRKMIIDEMDLTGTYSFRIADLDGSNELDTTLQKTLYTNKQMIYMDLSTYAIVDREPARDSWEMVFTKYMAPVGPGIYYPVTGVLTGHNIRSIRRADVPVSNDQYDTTRFENFISHIGYDWKSFDLQNMVYNCADSLTFFVEDRDFNVHKIYFTSFAGSSTGDIVLERSASLNLSIEENNRDWNIFPIPASDVLNISGSEAMEFELINGMGQVVRSGSESQIDVADLPSGLYYLRLSAAEGLITERVIIQ